VAVPEEALVPLEDRQYVYLVTADKKAERREIKIGVRQVGFVEVVSGLKGGEKVVVEGTLKLRPDADVRIAGDDKDGDRKKRAGSRGSGGSGS
jgi:membrane fusion protein (multidrug efflux system)